VHAPAGNERRPGHYRHIAPATSGVLDITATLRRPGCKETEVIVDQDGYVELRYWNHAGVTPAQVTAVIVRALTAVTTTQRT
jgi:hypothetical protein